MGHSRIVICDLDGTLALIDERRKISTKENGKLDWDIFFDPSNIDLDKPNESVIEVVRTLHSAGHRVVIFSGRSKGTKEVTRDWLTQNHVDDIVCVFDDRQKVVDMWRELGLTCMQVDKGDF